MTLTPWVDGRRPGASRSGASLSPLSSPFPKSFVGVSFIVPGTFLLITLGGVIGASHISVIPGLGRGGHRLDPGRLDLLLDRLSLSSPDPAFLAFPPLTRSKSRKGCISFTASGTWAIFLGRFLGPFRATVPLVAGMCELEFWPFQIANAASAVIWAYRAAGAGGRGCARICALPDDLKVTALAPAIAHWPGVRQNCTAVNRSAIPRPN